MADPVTAGLLIAGSSMQAIGSLRQGNVADAAAKANAAQMERQADLTQRNSIAQDDLQRRKARDQLGMQLAASAESGGGINADALRQSIYDAEMDSATIRYEGNLRAAGLRDQATMTRWEGKQRKRAGQISAAASLLQGASMAYGKMPTNAPAGKPTLMGTVDG